MKSPLKLTIILLPLCALGLFFLLRKEKNPSPPKPSGPPWFQNATSELKLDFVHNPGTEHSWFMPQSMGSGAALIDFDQDGLLDLYLIQGAGPESKSRNQLFHQEKDGTFKNVSLGSNVDIATFGTGVAVGDVNNDGWPDLLLTGYGSVHLFLNQNGDGTFRDVTKEAGLKTIRWGTSASFLDLDRDGWLDLVIVNYVAYDSSTLCHNDAGLRDFCAPGVFQGTADILYRNLGATSDGKVRFEDVSEKSNLAKEKLPGLGVLCADFTGDGWTDIFVANDGKANQLWVNQHDGTFVNEASIRGLARSGTGSTEADMGVTIGDVDGDGLFDLFSTHLSIETHTLWKQGPRGSFRDVTGVSGLGSMSARSTGFGSVFGDLDRDGDLDLAFVNGRVFRSQSRNQKKLGSFWSMYTEKNRIFSNKGEGKFLDVSPFNPAFCDEPLVGRGLVIGDLDNDGDLDMLATYTGSEARIYRNVAEPQGHWLIIRAVDPKLKRDAYDTEVIVETGSKTYRRWINPGYSYQCSNDPRAHIGLGVEKAIKSVRVRWFDGSIESFPVPGVDQLVTVKKGAGEKLP